MASSSKPRFQAYKADGAISRGMAVKFGSDSEHVTPGGANTDRCIGIAQNTVTTAEDIVEVALPGGGAVGLLQEQVSAGDDLVSHTDGKLAKPNAEGDQIIGRAMDAGVASDIIPVEVYLATAHAAQ